jgi:hypothetical protein
LGGAIGYAEDVPGSQIPIIGLEGRDDLEATTAGVVDSSPAIYGIANYFGGSSSPTFLGRTRIVFAAQSSIQAGTIASPGAAINNGGVVDYYAYAPSIGGDPTQWYALLGQPNMQIKTGGAITAVDPTVTNSIIMNATATASSLNSTLGSISIGPAGTAQLTVASTGITAAGTGYITGNAGIGVSPNAQFSLDLSGTQSGNNSAGIFFSPTWTATGNSQAFYGFTGAASLNRGTFTGLTAYGFQLGLPVNSGSGTIATEYQFQLLGGSAATSLVGMDVASQTAGTSNNVDILLGSTTPSTGNFGIDQEDTYQDKLGGKVTTYNNVATAGIGLTPVVSTPRSTAVTNATASLTAYTVPAADSSYEVSANVNVTATTAAAMTVTCTYTDETNTSRTLTLGFAQLTGATLITSITNVTGTGPYESITYHIRCKASTTITFATVGTVTGIVYNVEGTVVQLQ